MTFTSDASGQNASSITYNKTNTAVVATTLPLGAGYFGTYAGAIKRSVVDFFLSFNPASIAKRSTFTLAVPSPVATETVLITLTDGSATPKQKIYTYTIVAGDTAAEIALGIAALANTNPFVVVSANVTASPAIITVEGAIPGQDYTLAISRTGTSVTLSAITTVAAASGAVNRGKVYSVAIDVSVSSDGVLQFQPTITSFDGAAVPVNLGAILLPPYKHANSLAQLQVLRGVV